MIKIAEVYIHFPIDVKDRPSKDFRALEDEFYSRYVPILREFRGERVLKVRVEDGSLKVWISVFGAI